MKHLGTVPLETDRLLLRRFTAEDASAMFANWASDDEVARYLTWTAHGNPELTATILASWVDDYNRLNSYQWAIELKELGEPIGSIGVVSSDDSFDSLMIGYCIGRQWWNQGLVTEAFSRLIDFFLDEVGAARIESMHDVANPASGRVMQKCGLLHEGRQHHRIRNNVGNLVDVEAYAILPTDPRP